MACVQGKITRSIEDEANTEEIDAHFGGRAIQKDQDMWRLADLVNYFKSISPSHDVRSRTRQSRKARCDAGDIDMTSASNTSNAIAARRLTFRRPSSEYFVATKPELLDREAIGTALGSKEIYWAKSMGDDVLEEMLQNSWCWGIYREHEGELMER